MKFFERMNVVLAADAYTAKGDATSPQGASASSSEQGYSYTLDATTPLPYIAATLKAGNSYSFNKGSIVRLTQTMDGVMIPSQDLGIDEQTALRNSIGLSKPFTIPWIKFGADSYIRYEWENTSDEGDRDSSRSRLQYGANARRSWRLGATTLSLDVKYANDERSFEGGGFSRNIGAGTGTEEQNDTFLVMLTMVRQLF